MAILDYSHIPVQTPPPGVLSNFVDPPNQTNKLFAVSAVLIVLSTIFLLLRFYTRLVLLVRTPEVGDCEHLSLHHNWSCSPAYYYNRSSAYWICMFELSDMLRALSLYYLV
jgi:hypothetical protein